MEEKPTVIVSGGFDPIHIGHIRLIQDAANHGKVIVVINNDNWLKKKKGYNFMHENDRKEIIESMKDVHKVVLTGHPEDPEDMSVCEALKEIKPDIFANGGDRKADNIPEYKLCEDAGISMVFNIGGEKLRSSSELVKNKNLNTK